MWATVHSLRHDHDPMLVLLSGLICLVAAVTALRFHKRACQSTGPAALLWSLLVGVVAGAGVWSTHFVAMLAFRLDGGTGYAVGATLISLAIAIAGLAAGFAVAARWKSRGATLTGGLVTGLSVAAMHFVGISAMHIAEVAHWSATLVLASIVISVAGCSAALLLARRLTGVAGWLAPPALLAVAIVGLHFAAMAAAQFAVAPAQITPADPASRTMLALVVASVAGLLLLATAALAVVETLARAAGLASIQAAFQHVPDGLALFDKQGRLMVWNHAYQRMIEELGVRLEPGIPRLSILKTLASNPTSGLTEESRSDWMNGQAEGRERVYPEWRLPDGQWRRAEMHPLPGGGSITSLTDITDLKRASAEMAEAAARAEAASQAKSDFLANMSHEIRTPLNGVLGMAQVMASGELAPEQRDRLRVIQDSGVALLGILNDILDLSKVQAGKLELEQAPFDVLQLADATLAAFQGAASAKGVGLVVDFDPATPRGWLGDPLRLRQVLSNLLGNALKFTAEGTVKLEVSAGADGLHLAIRDTGIGMDPEQIPRLFEKFSQADSSTTRRFGGTGLGLSICQELVELMGGRIDVSSEKGRGSCFAVTVPLARAEIDEGAYEPAHEEPAGEGGDMLRVLAAEDNRTNQIVLRSLLQPLGCELTIAENGREAVEAFRTDRYDIILMDAQMPEMGGVEATRVIRGLEADKGLVRTPIIALTANVMTHQIDEYLEAGMDGWVAKPIELQSLFSAIDEALAGAEAQAEAAAPHASASA